MPRILAGDVWYSPLASQALYEADYEQILFANADNLFPEYYIVPFRTIVTSEFGEAKPDFALIDRKYRLWWVVETELAHHTRSHVVQQASVFRNGIYDASHAAALHAKDLDLNLDALKAMMKGVSPKVLFIVNSPHAPWREELERDLDCTLMVVEVFRSDRDKTMLRINGSYPEPPEKNVLTTCRCDKVLNRMLSVDSPGAIAQRGEETIEISFEGGITTWKLVEVGDQAWLAPTRSNPLDTEKTFNIVVSSSGDLEFETV